MRRGVVISGVGCCGTGLSSSCTTWPTSGSLIWSTPSLSRSFGGVYMPFLNLFIVYLIITDAVSVIAHMQRLGIPVPDLLRRVLVRSKRKVERAGG